MANNGFFLSRLSARPNARARVLGDSANPNLHGTVDFFTAESGTIVVAEFWGLPYDPAPCAVNINAMHIHADGNCSDSTDTAFMNAGGHYNPKNCPHPAHAGDLPPLFSFDGYAFESFFTGRFTVDDVIGRSVIVHAQRDDFTSQPAGDAGKRIGCGVIERML